MKKNMARFALILFGVVLLSLCVAAMVEEGVGRSPSTFGAGLAVGGWALYEGITGKGGVFL